METFEMKPMAPTAEERYQGALIHSAKSPYTLSETMVCAFDITYRDGHAAGFAEALEVAAALCENHAERTVRGIILAPELAGEFPDDGDPLAPMLPDNGAVATVANDLAKVRLRIVASGIRSLATAPTGEITGLSEAGEAVTTPTDMTADRTRR